MQKFFNHLVAVLGSCFFGSLSFGSDSIRYLNYDVKGLSRSHWNVIQTELDLCNCPDDPEKLSQVLLSTSLFYQVDIDKSENRVSIALKEKWTTIPIAKANSGGGVQGFTFGVYDPNAFGRRIELGAQYESFAGAPSFVLWNKVPRLFETRLFSDLQMWRTQRIRLKYNQVEKEPRLTKAFLQASERDHFGLGYEWPNQFRARIIFEQQKDRFSTDRIPSVT